MYTLSILQLVSALVLCASGTPAPAPGRVPKVYNALITSNQNLEPSKAYPVYQPVLHDPFVYPYQPLFYGDYPISNNLNPSVLLPPQQPQQPRQPQQPQPPPQTQQPAQPPSPPADDPAPPQPSESPAEVPKPQGSSDENAPPALPPQPSTKPPIPLNQFGLPSQVLPLGRFNPAYNGFTQVTYPTYSGFPYPYPGFRFYDPYDPFSLNPYASLPTLYRPLYSQGPQGAPRGPDQPPPQAPPAPADSQPEPNPPSNDDGASSPPPEPSDLNALNYSSKDPSIPDVPPPPLPSGGIRDDKSE